MIMQSSMDEFVPVNRGRCHSQGDNRSYFERLHACAYHHLISKGAVGHDNVTFEGGLVDFVCQVPWSPGKVPSTPAVLRCPSARWIAPFSAGVAPFFPKSYAHLRMVTPFTEGVTPFADGLRSFPRDSQGLRRPTPLPRVGGSFAMHVGSARRGEEYVLFLHAL